MRTPEEAFKPTINLGNNPMRKVDTKNSAKRLQRTNYKKMIKNQSKISQENLWNDLKHFDWQKPFFKILIKKKNVDESKKRRI